VLAVVVTGLLLGHKAPVLQSARSRIAENINWRTVQFLLENVVFLLIGLQVRRIVTAVARPDLRWNQVVWPCVAVLAATILARAVWMAVVMIGTRVVRSKDVWPWSFGAVVSWAGMRGVVTLAAVFLLPDDTPQRPLLALAAFVVVAGTLLIQGLTLPGLVRVLKLQGPNAAEDALQQAGLVNVATNAGLAVLEEIRSEDDPPEVIEELRNRALQRSNRVWEQLGRAQDELEPPAAAYRRLRLQMLAAERSTLLEARDSGRYDDEVLRRALNEVDMEESLLDRIQDAAPQLDEKLAPADARAGDCEHLRAAPRLAKPRTPNGCEQCLRDGTRWVHLRLCLECGHVGCCDSSTGKHATAHYAQAGHPVMRSFEPGEAWRWCFVDEVLG